MVLGWRRAFCTSFPKDKVSNRDTEPEPKQLQCETRPTSKFGFFSNPSTPRPPSQAASGSTLRCRTTATSSVPNSPKPQKTAVPESPRSPSSFSLLKSSLRLSGKQRSRCGICVQTVRSGEGTAIFTAECSHLFHFPCIAAHVRARQFLVCPVCNTVWKDLPLLGGGERQKPISELHSGKLRDVKVKSLRVYNDDEPLMSPTSGVRFSSIPESNEDDGEEDGEFQGFIVNPTFSPSPKSSTRSDVSAVEVQLLPEAAVLAVGRRYETYAVMMRVKGPPADTRFRRAPIDVVAVVEVSGTMTGNKLETLKRAMRLIISSLSEADRLSVVAFSAASKRLLPLRRMTASGRRSARRIVDALGSASQGMMCVSDALKKAAKVLEDRRQKNSVASIILLSDGQKDTVSSTRFSHMDTPVLAVSIGDDGAYGHAPTEDALRRCLGSLLSVVVQDLKLHLGLAPGSGSGQAEIAGVYSVSGKPAVLGSGPIRVGDVFAEEERELLVELRVPTSSTGSHQFLTVRSSYKDSSSGVLVETKEQALTVPRPQAARSSTPTIKRLRNLHVSVRAIAESRRLIEHNDFSGAHHMLTSARALLMKSSSGSAEELLRGLEAEQADLQRRRMAGAGRAEEKSEPLTPTSAWRAAERLAKVAMMRKSLNRVSDLHGFENARF